MRAVRRGSIFTLVLTIEDDLHIPAKDGSPKDVLDADHVELWWVMRGPRGPFQKVQLGIARGVDGLPVAVWFRPPLKKHAVPTVRWPTPGRLEVDLPVAWFPWQHERSHPGATNGPVSFTAVFSDSDGMGQETLISTSSWLPRPGDSLGSLLIIPEGRPLPVLGTLSWPDSWQQVDEAALLAGPLW